MNIKWDGKLIFLFPIYWRDSNASNKASKRKENLFLRERESFFKEMINTEYSPRQKTDAEALYNRRFWVPWELNEIIAFLEIYLFENKLFPFLYTCGEIKNTHNFRKRVFKIDEKFFTKGINVKYKTTDDVVNKIVQLENPIKELFPSFKNYYFDFSTVVNLSKYIYFK